jgi:hypothetical protein
MDLIAISKTQLHAAMLRWEEKHRAGECKPYEECLARPAEEVVAESTESLWSDLVANLQSEPVATA